MTDRNRELVPDNWSLVRERALTTGLSSEDGILNNVHVPPYVTVSPYVTAVCCTAYVSPYVTVGLLHCIRVSVRNSGSIALCTCLGKSQWVCCTVYVSP